MGSRENNGAPVSACVGECRGGGGGRRPPPTLVALRPSFCPSQLSTCRPLSGPSPLDSFPPLSHPFFFLPSSLARQVDPAGPIAAQDLFSVYVHTLPGYAYRNGESCISPLAVFDVRGARLSCLFSLFVECTPKRPKHGLWPSPPWAHQL
jgi:hypothetical protein